MARTDGGETRKCAECGAGFWPRRRCQRYCSKRCSNTACHRRYVQQNRDRIRAIARESYRRHPQKAPGPARTCPNCQRCFTPRAPNQVYCGARCTGTAKHRRWRAKHRAAANAYARQRREAKYAEYRVRELRQSRAWRAANPEKVKQQRQRQLALERLQKMAALAAELREK